MKKAIIITLVLAIAAVFLFGNSITGKTTAEKIDATIYKSTSCGCCTNYVPYIKTKGFNVNVETIQDIYAIKKQFNVPIELGSCHTTIIGDYLVEGHVPIEAINKLLEEKPNIAGIALPEMPSGSPGMPGSKTEQWKIYAVNHDGTYSEFMVL